MIMKSGMLTITTAAFFLSACGGGGTTEETEITEQTKTTSELLLKGKTFYYVESCQDGDYFKSTFSDKLLKEEYLDNEVIDSFSSSVEYTETGVTVGDNAYTVTSNTTSVTLNCEIMGQNFPLWNSIEEAKANVFDDGCGMQVNNLSDIVGLWDASYNMGEPVTQYLYISEKGVETFYEYFIGPDSEGKTNCFWSNQAGTYTENANGNFDYTDGISSYEKVIRMLENGALEFTSLYQDQDPFTIIREKAPVSLEEVTSKLCYP